MLLAKYDFFTHDRCEVAQNITWFVRAYPERFTNYHVNKNISFPHESERAKVILHFRELTKRLEYREKMEFMLENQSVKKNTFSRHSSRGIFLCNRLLESIICCIFSIFLTSNIFVRDKITRD